MEVMNIKKYFSENTAAKNIRYDGGGSISATFGNRKLTIDPGDEIKRLPYDAPYVMVIKSTGEQLIYGDEKI